MLTSYESQKEQERRILDEARNTSPLIPSGYIELSEAPDLRINTDTGQIAVEVTELVRSKGEGLFSPVQDEIFHREVVRLAEKDYYRTLDAEPVCVGVCFLDDERCKQENPEGWSRLADNRTGRRLEKMVRSLVQFVKTHAGAGSATYKKREMVGQMDYDTLPTGFELIGISSPPASWHSGESGTISPTEPEQLQALIRKKDKLLPKYRAQIPDSPIWLLIYNGFSLSRGVWIPRSIDFWKFSFGFDRVLLFSVIDNRVYEIGRL